MKEPSDGVLAGLRSASSVAADAAGAPEVSVRSDSRSAGMGVAWTKETPRETAGSEHGVPAAIREVRKQKLRRGREMEPASPVGGGGAHVRGPAGRSGVRFILRRSAVVKSRRRTPAAAGHGSSQTPACYRRGRFSVSGERAPGAAGRRPRGAAGVWASEGSSDENQRGTEISKNKKSLKKKKTMRHEFSVENILMKKPD